MNLHEYQAKGILEKYGIKVQKGYIATTPDEAINVAKKIKEETGTEVWVVKAQVHAGGRGKAGGIKIAKTLDEVANIASNLLGKRLVTHQTGPEGKPVSKVLICEDAYTPPFQNNKELYFSILIDRKNEEYAIIFSAEGGMEIEELSKKNPEKIIKINIDPRYGYMPYHTRYLLEKSSLSLAMFSQFHDFIQKSFRVFSECHCSLLEINPLLLNSKGELVVVDCKLVLEDNGLIRNPELIALRDPEQEDPLEVEAVSAGLSFVKLNGNIGCMVNGAGLAMATMDIIKLYGGEPANFLDVGGTADPDRIAKGFNMLLKSPGIKAIFVNIFGGIVRCDRVATGIIQAYKQNPDIKVPVVARLHGTNADIAKSMFKESGFPVVFEDDLETAAQKLKTIIDNGTL